MMAFWSILANFDLTYPSWKFFALFLPVLAVLWQLSPAKWRRMLLLAADMVFFWSFSGILVVFLLYSSLLSFGIGLWLKKVGQRTDLKRKIKGKLKKKILIAGILLLLMPLIGLKYMDFIGLNLVRLSHLFHVGFDWKILNLAVPVGISYFTLEGISYLTDVYRESIEAEDDFLSIFLFFSFFPKLLEGPITRYGELSETLNVAKPISGENLAKGYQRILWGLFKKLVIADHLAPAVDILFQGNVLDGSLSLAAGVFFVFQQYMDFSGSIDIVIGAAGIFGVKLNENFRQPFFAKNVSDFWRRWHITLGTWLKDYVFYPVSVSKGLMKLTKRVKQLFGQNVSRLLAPSAALFCVWLCNGLWHGPRWTYIAYGLYHFSWIFLENLFGDSFSRFYKFIKLSESSLALRIFRGIKLFLIVMVGEMIFRADSLSFGLTLIWQIFTNFHWKVLIDGLGLLGMDVWDYWTAAAGLIIVLIVSILKERGYSIREKLMACPVPVRFAFWYAAIFIVIVFGAYGSGYDAAGMIYAKF
ncbi:MAG: MBOAT family protein [Lachnospiraceae bacterium]|nr:MBOAT family protein [Lachnospiraceae bacterium]